LEYPNPIRISSCVEASSAARDSFGGVLTGESTRPLESASPRSA
jgi:hypothetical protein